jgi:hypothetical protein
VEVRGLKEESETGLQNSNRVRVRREELPIQEVTERNFK